MVALYRRFKHSNRRAAALLLLWVRGKSILDQWLMVAVCALIGQILLVGFFVPGRFNFYFAHVLAVASSIVVLVATAPQN
jgi:hypothetical protein